MDTVAAVLDLMRRGETSEAERICETRLAIAADDAGALSLLAEIQLATGRTEGAAASLERLTALAPRDAAVHRRLAGALLALGRPEQAATVLRRAIDIDPSTPRAHNNLGQALMQLGKPLEAIESYERALRLDDGYAIAQHNLALACMECGELDRAVQSFARALALDSSLIASAVSLAAVLDRQQRYEAALACLEHACTLRPGDPGTMTQKAHVLLALHRAELALRCADAALEIDERRADTHNVRAGALRRLGRRAEALEALDRTLALDPAHAEGWGNRAMILHETGDLEAAMVSGRKALELDPDGIRVRTRMLARLIPSVPLTEDESRRSRRAFEEELRELESSLSARSLSQQEALIAAQQQFFYLTYEEESNRRLLEAYRRPCAARLAEFEHLTTLRPRYDPAGGRLRLGIVSAHIHDHSVFNAIVRGWLEHLDKERIEITVFSLGSTQDGATHAARTLVDHFEAGERPVSEWAAVVRDRALDALIYPEVGMNETALALASLRLSPRQFAAWGHPETTGMPTIDEYLSAELFEPPEAEDHYTERLVRLPNLGVHCRPYATTPSSMDLARWAVAGDGPVLICPGVPFKYRPRNDRILVEIARRLGRCTFIFFEHEITELSRKLEARIAAAFRDAGLDPLRYLRLIPWQPRAEFLGLMSQADVFLDTIGFSGFNTVMQAVECRLPCVTLEGRFLRGRLGSGILKCLGIPELVAARPADYVELAVGLAENAAHRERIRERIRSSAPRLYADARAVAALERLLLEGEETSRRLESRDLQRVLRAEERPAAAVHGCVRHRGPQIEPLGTVDSQLIDEVREAAIDHHQACRAFDDE
ncbi:MAG TPA: tetratricopeptide repeat protein [Steroidobacteraceae bacterium]|nr:tetratricopeptide repeat protein [Steroidobacteraceae bacterium]